MSVFDQFNSAYFNSMVGDKATTVLNGSNYTFYGIFKSENVQAFDHAGRGLLITNTTMQVSSSVANVLPEQQQLTVGSNVWTLQEKKSMSNGQVSVLVLSKVTL